ncbi:hypothetical protein [Chlamydiifrater phoenicopteri]|uniref:hypothetical protein n=1 Tax=Chlamydiifrater phoenicopteri TaxID=2681469 RepID=UPI001BCAABA2|nr:hypothetical protein [Chlamydiifrater phoenicopteri]
MYAHGYGRNRTATGKLNVVTLDDINQRDRPAPQYSDQACRASMALMKELNRGAFVGTGLFVASAILECVLSLSLLLTLGLSCPLTHYGVILAMVIATVIFVEALLRLIISASISMSAVRHDHSTQ